MLRQFTQKIYCISNVKFYYKRKICSTMKLREAENLPTESQVRSEAPECPVIVEKDSHITLIGINQPKNRNSLDATTAQHLWEAINAFEMDESSPVAVLYGVGGSFCAGHNLDFLEQQLKEKQIDTIQLRKHNFQKPIVCGINGYCVGIGLELALMCDLRVMEDGARLGFFNRRYGVPNSAGSTMRLVATIGASHAMDLMLTGRRVDAEEALHMGLIDRLVANGTSLGQAVNLAFSIAKYPNSSLLHDRNSLYKNGHPRVDFKKALQNERAEITSELANEIQEGVMRFTNSKDKGPKTNAWNIKQKVIPDWEKDEIAYEKQAALRKLNLER